MSEADGLEIVGGSYTALETSTGLPEQLKTAQGRVLTRDAGYLTFLDTFDSNGDFVSGQIVIERGPHPGAEQNPALICNLATSALGL